MNLVANFEALIDYGDYIASEFKASVHSNLNNFHLIRE